jgi:hypothetical protein
METTIKNKMPSATRDLFEKRSLDPQKLLVCGSYTIKVRKKPYEGARAAGLDFLKLLFSQNFYLSKNFNKEITCQNKTN